MKSRFNGPWIAVTISLVVGLVLPHPAYGEKIPVKLLQKDFRIMRHAMEEAHGGIYRYTSKEEMDRTFDKAYRKIDHQMTDMEFWRLAAPVVAHIKCGHTYLLFPKAVQTRMLTTLIRFPLGCGIFGDCVYIVEDFTDAHSSLEGSELLAINDVPTKRLLQQFRAVVNGDGNSATASDYRISHYGNFPVYLCAYGIESPFRVEYRDKEGKRQAVTLDGMELSKINEAWSARHSAEAPSVPNADLKFLDEGRIAVLTIRHWYEYADEDRKITFSDFLETSFAQFHEKNTGKLIIDVRDDTGGLELPVDELFGYLWNQPFHVYRDIYCSAREFDFYKYAPEAKPMPGKLIKGADGKLYVTEQPGLVERQPLQPQFGGRVFALMNGGSFSSSTEFLTLLHFYKRAKFIGQEPAGAYYGYTCGRMVCVILPNSKLELNFGILTYNLDVSGYKPVDRGVMPDYPVVYTISDVLAGKDKEMELALSLARSKN